MNTKPRKKTNVILILSDDQGPWAMGCAGNDEIITPNLDEIANNGMRFDNFFCTSPVCSPARASLLTGDIPSKHGVHDWIREGNSGKGSTEYLMGQLSYTDILRSKGYTCGISGKWHLGNSLIKQKGFEHWYVHEKGSGEYYNAPMIKNGKLIHENGYITDLITEDALEFIDNNAHKENPFYLSVHYTAPHSPWINNHPKKYTELYANCQFESCPQEPIHPNAKNLTKSVQDNIRGNLEGYFAAVTAMDENIGHILKKIKKLNLQEDTLICFMSDNGFSCGQNGFWGKGNATFPINMYDNSVKIPALFSHPGTIPPNETCSELASQYDFMPTLLDYLDIEYDENDEKPGKSFASTLLGEKKGTNGNIVVYDEYGPVRMIRSKEWKYIRRYPYGPDELYNIKNDPKEKNNLAYDINNRDTKYSMNEKLEKWFEKYADPSKDGTHNPITGSGQIRPVGRLSKGRNSFYPKNWKSNYNYKLHP